MVCGQPLARTNSLIETGAPSSGESGTPRLQRASDSRAAARADSVSTIVSALMRGFTVSARARIAVIASTGEAALVR